MILKCKCKHAYQDAQYGPGQRVHNFAPNAFSGAGGWRCTVCEAIKPKTTTISKETTP
jgi:hypothetical protein